MNSTNVTPRPTTDTSPPLPAAQALVLTAPTPPSDTTAEADADADDTPEGDPVLVALVPLAVLLALLPPPVAFAPPVGVGALPLLPL